MGGGHRSRSKFLLIIVPVICVFIALGWIIIKTFDGEKPVINISPDISYISKELNVNVRSQDYKSGLKSIVVSLTQGEKSAVLYKKDFQGEILSTDKNIKIDNATLSIKPKELGLLMAKPYCRYG